MTEVNQTVLLRQVRLAMQDQNYAAAIDYLTQAVELARQAGDLSAEGRHLGNLALIYYRINQPDEALDYFSQALERARQEHDRLIEDGILGNMGNILRELKRYDQAIDYLNRALLIANEIGDIRGRGMWLGNLGLVYDDLKQPDQALDLHQQSVAVARQLQDRRGLASRLSNLGNSYLAMGDLVGALKAFEEVVTLYEILGDHQGLALRMGIIGNVYAELGRRTPVPELGTRYLQTAIRYYERTLDIAREVGDRVAQGELLSGIGNAYGNMGHFDQAIQQFTAAYALFEALGMRDRCDHVRQSIDLALGFQNRQTNA